MIAIILLLTFIFFYYIIVFKTLKNIHDCYVIDRVRFQVGNDGIWNFFAPQTNGVHMYL